MKKEDIIKDLAKTAQANMDYERNDKRIRLEFAKAFEWKKEKKQYDYTDEWYLPSWEEIFIQIGLLLASQKFKNQWEDIEALGSRIMRLEQAQMPKSSISFSDGE